MVPDSKFNGTQSCVFPQVLHNTMQSCHDATGCGGNEVTGVSNASDCCLGRGLSFRDGETCRQCIGKQLIVFIKLLQSK